MSRPVLSPAGVQNVYGKEEYSCRVTLGASSAFTCRSKDVVVTRPTTTTLKLVLPELFTEIVSYEAGRLAAASVAGLEWIITDNSVAVDGSVTLTSIATTGTATAPAAGDVAYITIGVSRDALNDRFTGSG